MLSTKWGRLTAFFLLYMTEGIPQGFTSVALAYEMRREGISVEAIGVFVATLYLPWSWKWLMGPIVDVVHSDRLGRRRAWIVGCQTMMIVTLLAIMPFDPATSLTTITWIVLVHNIFAATQDVAIDALACSVLPAAERGIANGLMFAGAYLGSAVGGSGVLLLIPRIGFAPAYLMVVVTIALITGGVSLRLREPRQITEALSGSNALVRIGSEITTYVRTILRSIFGNVPAMAGLIFAILPTGSLALGLVLQSALAVELGLKEEQVALLSLWSTILAAGGCVLGGLMSDRFGRRRMLTLYVLLMSIPTLVFAWKMQSAGWIFPVKEASGEHAAPQQLVTAFWGATLAYSLLQGLMYGARPALFMDLCNPAIGATQFTAYMSLMNLAMAYSALWQGFAAARLGYPVTLTLDALGGCVCLAVLPLMKRPTGFHESTAAGLDQPIPESSP